MTASTVPVARIPSVAVSVMRPMTWRVTIPRMWWCFPAATCPYIGSVFFTPVFVYPHLAWAWCGYPYHCLPCRPYTYIYLRLAAVCACCKHNCQHDQYFLHVFHNVMVSDFTYVCNYRAADSYFAIINKSHAQPSLRIRHILIIMNRLVDTNYLS